MSINYYWLGFDAGYAASSFNVNRHIPFGLIGEQSRAFINGFYDGYDTRESDVDEYYDSGYFDEDYPDDDFFDDDFFDDDYYDEPLDLLGRDYCIGYEHGAEDAVINEQAAYFQGASDALAFVCLVIEAMLDG